MAGPPEGEAGAAGYAALPMAEDVGEPPLTGREVLQYVLMFVVGLLITAATVWFYSIIE